MRRIYKSQLAQIINVRDCSPSNAPGQCFSKRNGSLRPDQPSSTPSSCRPSSPVSSLTFFLHQSYLTFVSSSLAHSDLREFCDGPFSRKSPYAQLNLPMTLSPIARLCAFSVDLGRARFLSWGREGWALPPFVASVRALQQV